MEKGDTAISIAVAVMLVLAFILAYSQGYLDPIFSKVPGLPMNSGGQWVPFEPEVNITAPPVSENLSFIENRTFTAINMERAGLGLLPLGWNGDLAYVARLYSQEMAERDFFSHSNPEGESHSDRLHEQGVYYYNRSAENLAKINHVKYFTYIGSMSHIINKTYRNLDEVAMDAVKGWMESASHRENIADPNFMESGIGVAYDREEEMFYFTQLFIIRIHCGYANASCCQEKGYLPWCYRPWSCMEGVCS